MNAQFFLQGNAYVADLTRPADLSYPLRHGAGNPKAWYVANPSFTPVRGDNFVGSVRMGGAVNFYNVQLNPHGNGTHTECIGHITPEHQPLNLLPPNVLIPCQLITITATRIDNDLVLATIPETIPGIEAIAIRSQPTANPEGNRDFSGSNPPYFNADLLETLAKRGILHLITDLPSVDKEEDGGRLAGHRAWWHYPHQPRMAATITEMANFPDELHDGLYLLNLQIPNWELDAAPSRPLLFPVAPVTAL